MIFNNKTDSPASFSSQNSDEKSKLIRLIEDPDIKKTIKFDEMSIADRGDPISQQGGGKKENEMGLNFPMIRVNDWMIPKKNLSKLTISSTGIIPTINVSFSFEDTTFVNKNTPKDGDIISLFLRVSTDSLMYLRDDFIITGCSSRVKNGVSSMITLSGMLFIPDFNAKYITDCYHGTSKGVVRYLAQRYGLGFAFNDYDDTNDYQNWYKCQENGESFLNNITSHAWKDEVSFFKSWIDLYYNICFVNVNKFLLTNENEEEVDIMFTTNVMTGINELGKQNVESGAAKLSVKILTNDPNFKGTPFYIKSWKPTNISTSTSFSTGYEIETYSFKHNQNLLNNSSDDCFSKLSNIPTYDQNKVENHILLRGRATYDKDKNPENEMARVNYNFVDTYNNKVWTGVEYTMADDDMYKDSNEWSGNVHKNYNRAPQHNRINLNELDKIYLTVQCEGLCLQIMRGERVPVLLVYESEYEEKKNANFNESDIQTPFIRFYSGYYFVDSVEYKYNPISESLSPYTTTFVLRRKEWPTPESI